MALSFNIKDTILDLSVPRVMGILNSTSDSFFDGGAYTDVAKAMKQVEQMISEGAYIIDIGGYSSRPGADDVPLQEELDRVLPLIEKVSRELDCFISIDTFRAKVAQEAVEAGAHIVNDISAGDDDPNMISTVAALQVPYIYMHKQGTSKTMQINPQYDDAVEEVYMYLKAKKDQLLNAGVKDLIVDPGFGFGKTVDHNFQLLASLKRFEDLDIPLLAGVSRKSMINKVLGTKPLNALNGTSVLHAYCLLGGAKILRVHDVKPAIEAIKLYREYAKWL